MALWEVQFCFSLVAIVGKNNRYYIRVSLSTVPGYSTGTVIRFLLLRKYIRAVPYRTEQINFILTSRRTLPYR